MPRHFTHFVNVRFFQAFLKSIPGSKYYKCDLDAKWHEKLNLILMEQPLRARYSAVVQF